MSRVRRLLGIGSKLLTQSHSLFPGSGSIARSRRRTAPAPWTGFDGFYKKFAKNPDHQRQVVEVQFATPNSFLCLFGAFAAFLPSLLWGQTAIPVSFDLAAATNATAIQFDVNGSAGTVSWNSPVLSGSSTHLVEIGPVGGTNSGKTRYVVYSTSGAPISPTGKVTVNFVSSSSPANGLISVNGVVASDANGQSVSASPTALPVAATTNIPHLSVQSGQTTQLSASVVDLDGTVASVSFSVGGQNAGSAPGSAPVVLWNATGSGLQAVTALATDNSGRSASIQAANLHIYSLADFNSYAAYQNIHFGPGASGAAAAFGADPYGTGLPNGLAFVLGLNPKNPDLSQLPRGEAKGADYVFSFSRPSYLPAGSWSVAETGDFKSWGTVPGNRISEGAAANNRVPVEARVPLSTGKDFLKLRAVAVP